MKMYNLIIMNDCWEPKVTPYLGSFSSKEKAITGFKRFLKEATKDKETLVKIYQNMEEDYAEDDYSLIGEAVQIIVTDVDELCDYDYSKTEMVVDFDVRKVYKEAIANYEQY